MFFSSWNIIANKYMKAEEINNVIMLNSDKNDIHLSVQNG